MNKKYKVLLVDDERLARVELKYILNDFADRVEIVGEADSITSAVREIELKSPDLVFLDIQLGSESGFDLLEKIPATVKVIFVTAFDEYAIKAFEVNALDYLLKPVNPQRMQNALEKLKNAPTKPVPERIFDEETPILIAAEGAYRIIKINNIKRIHSAGDYTQIITGDGKEQLVLKSLREWESRLPSQKFARIHRSTIVNFEYVERIEQWFKQSWQLYLKNEKQPCQVSRRYAKIVKDRLQW